MPEKLEPTEKRDALVRALQQLIEADQEVRSHLQRWEGVLRRGIRRVEQGDSLASTLELTRPGEARQTVNDALRSLAAARHDMRVAVTAAALEEGLSVSDIARSFGISRQLVQRYVQETKGEAGGAG